MNRREFITLLGSAAAAPSVLRPLAARAQQGKVRRIGFLETIAEAQNAPNMDAFRQGMREHHYIEGQNFVIEYRSADGRSERYPALAAELVRLNVDLILTRATPAAIAAKNATATIPIVMAASGDPLGTGLVASLARPGGNVTGLSGFTTDLLAKRVEILREAVPGVKRVGLVHNMGNPVAPRQWEELKAAAPVLGIEPLLFDARNPDNLPRLLETAVAQRTDAIVVGNDTAIYARLAQFVELAARHRLPATYLAREFVDAGGLMMYGVNYPDLYRRAAAFVSKIFKGAKPAELPIEQPVKFDLIVNVKAAKALGIVIPETFLTRADEVIE
jgi:putative ABC transport system substrate-binding protein